MIANWLRAFLRKNFTRAPRTVRRRHLLAVERLEARDVPTTTLFESAAAIGGSGTAVGQLVATDAQGDVYTAGTFHGTITLGTQQLTSSAYGDDLYLCKMDRAGDVVWATQIGTTSGNAWLGSIGVDAAGNVALSGYFRFAMYFGSVPLEVGSSYRGFLARFDSTGEYVASRVFGQSCFAAVDATGDIFITGVNGYGGNDFDTFPMNGSEYLAKMNPDGWLAWAEGMDSGGGAGVALDGSGNIYTAGQGFVSKLDADGIRQWATPIPDSYYFSAVGVDAAGDAYVRSAAGPVGPPVSVTRLDHAGAIDWTEKLNGNPTGGLAVDAAGDLYLTGSYEGITPFGNYSLASVPSTPEAPSVQDAFIAKLDPDGNYLSVFDVGGISNSGGSAIAVGPDGQVALTGWFTGLMDFDPGPGSFFLNTADGSEDAFVLQLNCGDITADNGQATVVVASSQNPSLYGQDPVFTATVTGNVTPGDTVTFNLNGAALTSPISYTVVLDAANQATFDLQADAQVTLPLGWYALNVTFNGDENLNIASGALASYQQVALGSTTALGVNVYGSRVVFAAGVSSPSSSGDTPTGTVQFYVDGEAVGAPVELDGTGMARYSTTTVAVGDHTATAVYTGDPTYAGSTSAPVSFTIAPQVPGAGDLDPTFGNQGMVLTPLVDQNGEVISFSPNAVAVQAVNGDQRAVLAGSALYPSGESAFALARYLSDGELDPSFGTGGIVILPQPGSWDTFNAIAIQGDQILVAGTSDTSAVLARFDANGNLDSSFATAGMALTDFSSDGGVQVTALAVDHAGRILIAGSVGDPMSGSRSAFACRFNSTGLPDSSFGPDGTGTAIAGVLVPDGYDGAGEPLDVIVKAAIVLDDNSIVLAGNAGWWGGSFVMLTRFTKTGDLDTTFGADGNGFVFESPGVMPGYMVNAAVLQRVGLAERIVIAGNSVALDEDGNPITDMNGQTIAADFMLAGFTLEGAADPAFNGGQPVLTDFGQQLGEVACSLVTQPDGKLVVVGTACTGQFTDEWGNVLQNWDFAAARYVPNGGLDTTFGNGAGWVTTDLGGADTAFGIALQSDGKLVLAGRVDTTNPDTGEITSEAALVRYLGDTVTNVAPTLAPASNQVADQGVPTSFNLGSFTDPGTQDTWTVTVNWGDGSPATMIPMGNTQGAIPAQVHTYAATGTYSVTVAVQDNTGGQDVGTFQVAVGTRTSVSANFNGTPITAGNYLWFSSILNPEGLSKTANTTIWFVNQRITLGGTTLAVPDARITYHQGMGQSTTTFSNGVWFTDIYLGSHPNGDQFLSALGYDVPANLPGGIKNVTWSGDVFSDQARVDIKWKWAAAVYTALPTAGQAADMDYSAMLVKPVDDKKTSDYKNLDNAGTPEGYVAGNVSIKSRLVGGATGNGRSNWTGGYSHTEKCRAQPVQDEFFAKLGL